METIMNKTTEILKNNSRIDVDIEMNTVFVEATQDGFHILLETTDIDGNYEIEITKDDVQITDEEVIKAIDLFIYEYALNIRNNTTPVFDESDKQNATNLIYA